MHSYAPLLRCRFTNEFCAVANSSEIDVNATMGTFGWADTKCSTLAPHMCRISREWQANVSQSCSWLPFERMVLYLLPCTAS
jgi:hypothetical protein